MLYVQYDSCFPAPDPDRDAIVEVMVEDLDMALRAATSFARYNGSARILNDEHEFVMMIWSGELHTPHEPGAALMLQLHENEVVGVEALLRDRHRVHSIAEILSLYYAYVATE